VDAQKFLGLEPTHNPHRWVLEVTPGITTPGNFLFGGCGLGAAIAAMEGTTGRELVWATAQYLSYAQPPSVLDLDVTIAVHGKAITQARCVAHVTDTEILTVNAALGHRDLPVSGEWAVMPSVPAPEDCDSRPMRMPDVESISNRIDLRMAVATPWDQMQGNPRADGRASLWARMPDMLEPSAATLAILGDYVPFGIGQALGAYAGGNSLDNTLRVASRAQTEWILADIRVHAIADGFGHGLVHLWTDDGRLLGTASQSTIVRNWREEPPNMEPRTTDAGGARG
jgi:acyl-CoA thioesterase